MTSYEPKMMCWNVDGGLGDESRARHIIRVIKNFKPDIAIFPEAWHEEDRPTADMASDKISQLGYALTEAAYNDEIYNGEARSNRLSILGLVRQELTVQTTKNQSIRLAGRTALALTVLNPAANKTFDVYGLHLDDRHEKHRLEQTKILLGHIGLSRRVVLGGDFNSMTRNVVTARILRGLLPFFSLAPKVDYEKYSRPPIIIDKADQIRRLTEMAQGTTLQKLEDRGFIDADPRHYPTIGPVNLDHILTRGIGTKNYRVIRQTPYSDHRAITAKLKFY